MHKLFSDREQQCQLTGREKERLLLGKLVSLSRQTDFKVWARIKYLSACLPDLLPHMPTPEMLQWPSGSASAYYGEGGASNGVFEEAEATINTIQVGEAQSVALCLYSTHFIIIKRAHRCQGINSLTLPHATLRTHAHTHTGSPDQSALDLRYLSLAGLLHPSRDAPAALQPVHRRLPELPGHRRPALAGGCRRGSGAQPRGGHGPHQHRWIDAITEGRLGFYYN